MQMPFTHFLHFQPKPSKYHGKYRNYTKDGILKAYEAVKLKGMSIRKAADQFRVPRATLADRVSGQINPKCLKNEQTLFTQEEELSLIEHVEALAQLGYGATNSKLRDMAGELAYVLRKRRHNKPLSNVWLAGFLSRWNTRVSSVRPSSLDSYRAKSSTPEAIKLYFDNLGKTIQEHDLMDKPACIYNLDETGIQPEHRPPNIIAPLNERAQAVTSPRSTTTTIIGCVNAMGNHLPPYFIFKGKRQNPDLMKGTSPGSHYTMSDSGWSNAQIFREYLETHFLPNVRRGSNDNQVILLIFDGSSTHTSKQLIEWAISQNLILFVLPAHTSHILQPLDVAVFGPFKGFYYRECAAFMQEHMGTVVTRYDMAEIACKAYLKAMSPANIVSSFKKTGIYPLNRQAIEVEKLYPCEAFRDETPIQKIVALKGGKEAVEEFFRVKFESGSNISQPTKNVSCNCDCSSKHKSTNKKPNPGGREITDTSYLEKITAYEIEKETTTPRKSRTDQICRQPQKAKSPQPSTSGISASRPIQQADKSKTYDSSDDEISDDESEVCCVCKKFSPPTDNKPYIKIVNWAFCDKCHHCVHLSFCHEKRVLRRGDTFLCPHCL